jgi:hypothetical protein
MLKGPLKTIRPVGLSEKGLTASDTGAETSVSERTSDSADGDSASRLLFPQHADLISCEAAVLLGCGEFHQRCFCTGVEDFGSAWAFSGAGGPGGLKPSKRVADGSLAAPNLRGDGLK